MVGKARINLPIRKSAASRSAYAKYTGGKRRNERAWTLIVYRQTHDPTTEDPLAPGTGWQGLRQLAPNLLAHPQIDRAALEEVLDRLNAAERLPLVGRQLR